MASTSDDYHFASLTAHELLDLVLTDHYLAFAPLAG